jgi:ABC-type nitrate/sulfonate/bicarbonate transport system ATPase subunit
MVPAIRISNLSKTFKSFSGKKLEVLHDVNLSVAPGEFFVLLGPSGSGKSTLLRIIAGIERDYTGDLTFAPGYERSDMSFVFQHFALMPWLTVAENVGLPLVARGIPQSEHAALVTPLLQRFGLEKFGGSYPKELSGGMQQRVGFARALVSKPKLLLLDEPFSALDSFIAAELRELLLGIWTEEQPTIVMVTHNIQEALELGSRVGVMTSRLGQVEHLVPVPLPRPRNMRSEHFFELEDRLLGYVKP